MGGRPVRVCVHSADKMLASQFLPFVERAPAWPVGVPWSEERFSFLLFWNSASWNSSWEGESKRGTTRKGTQRPQGRGGVGVHAQGRRAYKRACECEGVRVWWQSTLWPAGRLTLCMSPSSMTPFLPPTPLHSLTPRHSHPLTLTLPPSLSLTLFQAGSPLCMSPSSMTELLIRLKSSYRASTSLDADCTPQASHHR